MYNVMHNSGNLDNDTNIKFGDKFKLRFGYFRELQPNW